MRAPEYSGDPKELLESAVIENPHPFFARVRSQFPVARIGDTGVHMVSTWDGILEVLGREEDFSANLTGVLARGPEGKPSTFSFPPMEGARVIATADEPSHGVHRRLVKPRFASGRISELEPRVRAWARTALADWLKGDDGDFVPVSEIVPARVVGHLLGLPEGDGERHRAWAMMGGEILAGDVEPDGLRALAEETASMSAYLRLHLDASTAASLGSGQPSLLHLLKNAVDEGDLSRAEATGIAIVMFGAGGESTSALIGSAARLLAERPELVRRLREERALIPRFVEEVLRLEPPFKFHYRLVGRECELGDCELHPGDRLMLLWAAANRDPAVYDEPDALRLDRKYPKHHMSFGRGAHFCVGEQLARLEARIMIEEILEATTHFELDPDGHPAHVRSIFVRRLERLPILAG